MGNVEAVVRGIHDYIERALRPIVDRVRAVENRQPERGEAGPAGTSVTIEDVRALINAEIAHGLLDLERRASDMLQHAIDRIPPPQQGERGPPGPPGASGPAGPRGERGVDGLGFDDIDVQMGEDGRTLAFRFERGSDVREFVAALPVVYDCGIWREGKTYHQGDGVTFGGSFWIAQRATTAKPGDGSPDWRLAVKKGRDGRDGRNAGP